jgi:D-3-phosphoglycerate dehydrogenase / 2-oxoglutarate reductase
VFIDKDEVMAPKNTPRPKLFVDHDFPEIYADLVEGKAEIVGPNDADLADADAVIAGARRPWNAEAFGLAPNLKVISRAGIGYDNVDVAAATEANVVVCNAPEAPSVSTAEHTIALMMALGRQLEMQQARAREGLPGLPIGSGLEFNEKAIGLIGFGRIARRVSNIALALGMRVLAYDPFVTSAREIELVSLRDLLVDADVVSLHAPANDETRHMISAPTIAKMKPGVLIINCARGALIDQDALLEGLNSGHIGGAALDVTDPEPLPLGHPLLSHPKVIVTPHIASSTVAGRRRLYEHAIANALNVLNGKPATTVTE